MIVSVTVTVIIGMLCVSTLPAFVAAVAVIEVGTEIGLRVAIAFLDDSQATVWGLACRCPSWVAVAFRQEALAGGLHCRTHGEGHLLVFDRSELGLAFLTVLACLLLNSI